MTGGTLFTYKQVLSLFCKDIEQRLPLLQETPEMDPLFADALPALVTNIHALKSASASIGAAEVSARAAELEAVGKAGNLALLRKDLPAFAEQLAELIHDIKKALEPRAPENRNASVSSLLVSHTSILTELAEALKSQNISEIDRILDDINREQLDTETKEILEKISDNVLMAEFDSALKAIEQLLNK